VSYLSDPDELLVNIFYLDHDPRTAAQAHCDKHVVKMILESAQLLSTAWHVLAPDALDVTIGSTDPYYPLVDRRPALEARLEFGENYYIGNQRIYGKTHEHHPSAAWVRECVGNYDWLWRLGQWLLDEYTFRYGRQHASRHVLRSLECPPRGITPEDAHTEPPPAMPEELIVTDADGYIDAVASYRRYYREAKFRMLQYTKRSPPDWCAALAQYRALPSREA
jgi:hypothetical protein